MIKIEPHYLKNQPTTFVPRPLSEFEKARIQVWSETYIHFLKETVKPGNRNTYHGNSPTPFERANEAVKQLENGLYPVFTITPEAAELLTGAK